MNLCKLPPLIKQSLKRIGLIREAYMLSASYSANPYISQSMRDEGHNSMPLYRDMLIREFEIVKNILLNEMVKKEESI